MILAVRAVVAGMPSQASPELRYLLGPVVVIGVPVARDLALSCPARASPAGQPVPHGGREVLAVLRRPRAEPVGNPDLVDDLGWHRKVGDGQPLDLPSFGEHERSRPGGPPVPAVGIAVGGNPVTTAVASRRAAAAAGPAGLVQAGLQDDGQAGSAATGHADNVAGAQQRERSGRLGPAGTGPGPGELALAVRQRPAELRVLGRS